MGEYVVHLARHLGALQGPCLRDPAALLRLGATGPLAQRLQQLMARLRALTPAEQRGVDDDVEYGVPEERQPMDRLPQALDQVRDRADDGDQDRRTERPTERDGQCADGRRRRTG